MIQWDEIKLWWKCLEYMVSLRFFTRKYVKTNHLVPIGNQEVTIVCQSYITFVTLWLTLFHKSSHRY